jgi:sulfatase maturation enzyme AslB (radical SAM superfamily)
MSKRGPGHRLKEPAFIVKGLLRYFKMRFFSDLEPFGCSLAPTIRCNLKCPNCYEQYRRAGRFHKKKGELTVEKMEALVTELAQKGIRHCTITDGEPLIDRESLEKVEVIIDRFWVNYLVTNGTHEFPDYKVMYILSLDGPPKVHDSMRGQGVFDSIKKNVKSSPSDFIYALCTIDKQNREHIEDTVLTAQDLGLRGIMFNWKNPLSLEDPTWVPFSDRNMDIDEILGLRSSYGDFICNTEVELDHLRDPNWGDICPHDFIISIDAFGNRKRPCIFGSRADCYRCGCHVFPALLETVKYGRPSIEFRLILDYISNFWVDLSTEKMMKLVRLQALKR